MNVALGNMNIRFAPPPRSQTLSPVSTNGSEWSGMNGYDNNSRSISPFSPVPPYNQGNANGNAQNDINGAHNLRPNLGGRRPSNSPSRVPSPARSAANSHSSDGTLSDERSKKYRRMEAEVSLHYQILKSYLRAGAQVPPRPSKATEKLLKLSPVQFHELSTDVYDELRRRQAITPPLGAPPQARQDVPPYLLPRNDFHEKRNRARQKLSSLQVQRFRDLSTDVFTEIERRFPHFKGIESRINPAPRSVSRGPYDHSRQNSEHPSGASSQHTSLRSQALSPSPEPPPTTVRGLQSRDGPPRPFPGAAAMPAISVPQFDNPPLQPPENFYGHSRPTPKRSHSNTITPNKSTMVEDEDDAPSPDEQYRRSDMFALDSATSSLPSNRDTAATSRSGGSQARDVKVLDISQAQVAELQEKVENLEYTLKSKDSEIHKLEEELKAGLRNDWMDVKAPLEKKLAEAEGLNKSMKEQLERLQRSQSGSDAWKSKHDRLDKDYQSLQKKLSEQKLVTEEVRQQASGFLREMRAMADAGAGGNPDREEKLERNVQRLDEEVKEWKGRYARTKTQLRNIRTTSIGLSLQKADAGRYAKDNAFMSPNGLVKDVHITKFQIAIDELLHAARSSEPNSVLDYMKAVVVAVRNISQDIEQTSPVPADGTTKRDDVARRRLKIKSKVSATANNVITASKNFASSNGISPVSLLDAAASHLAAAVVELVCLVKIRPTPLNELDDDRDERVDSQLIPDYFSVVQSVRPTSANDSVYSALSTPSENHHQSPYSHGHRRSISKLAGGGGAFPNGTKSINLYLPIRGQGQSQTNEIDELKLYLDTLTDSLITSIQTLVSSIRAEEPLPHIRPHISAIAAVVADVVTTTESSLNQKSPIYSALREIVEPSILTLAKCRERLLAVGQESEALDHKISSSSPAFDGSTENFQVKIREFRRRLPPLAFEIARETKELVTRVEGVDLDMIDEDTMGTGGRTTDTSNLTPTVASFQNRFERRPGTATGRGGLGDVGADFS